MPGAAGGAAPDSPPGAAATFRMRSADSSSVDVAGAGLRRSLDMLSQEANALADALERVNSGEAERMRKVAAGPGGDSGAPPAAPGKREKA